MKTLFREVIYTRFYARIIILCCSLASAIFGLAGPFFQKEFIDHITHVQSHISVLDLLPQGSTPLWLILAAFFCVLCAQAFIQLTNYLGAREALILQRIFAERLYEKTLNMKVDAMSKRPVGEIVSLYATDVQGATVFLDQTLPAGASTLFPLLLAPVAISILFEIPIWPTVLVMTLISALNTFMGLRQSKFFYKFKRLAAERIGLVNEWIQNIRTIRILGWTQHFEKSIFIKREVETNNRVMMVTNGQFMNSLSSSVTFILNTIALGSFIYFSKRQITGGELLALLWIVGIFLTRPFRQMPWFFTFGFDSWTSLKRLEEFFNSGKEDASQTETSEQRVVETAVPAAPPGSHGLPDSLAPASPAALSLAKTTTLREPAVKPTDTAFSELNEHSADERFALQIKNLRLHIGARDILKNINLNIEHGEFVAIVGEVGCGKSMLLLSLLKETAAKFDFYHIGAEDAMIETADLVRAHFAYVPQEGFIMSASLRENVAFLYDIDPDRDPMIEESLKLAQFDLSTERVEKGLNTEIGERGVNLSGGQKQRVSLARVHLHKAAILLLDDCLSAVDVDTEHKLFEQLLLGAWQNRTRILVTHRLSALHRVDRILFMEEGQIVDQGSFEQLLARNEKFREYTTTVAKESAQQQSQADPHLDEVTLPTSQKRADSDNSTGTENSIDSNTSPFTDNTSEVIDD